MTESFLIAESKKDDEKPKKGKQSMRKNEQPERQVNTLETIHNSAEDIFALLYPVPEPRFKPISGLPSGEPGETELPPWRLAGGLVNSLVKAY